MADTKEKTKPTPPKREGRFKKEQVITLLADKEKTPYGPKNNPKREGTASAERFALYKNGMTVGKYQDAGGKMADIAWDVDKKYISVK